MLSATSVQAKIQVSSNPVVPLKIPLIEGALFSGAGKLVTVAAGDYRLFIRHAMMDTGSNTKRMGIPLVFSSQCACLKGIYIYSKEEQIKVTVAAIIVDV